MENKEELILREKDGGVLARNLKCLEKLKYNELIENLKTVGEKEIKINPQIVIKGDKNPLISAYVGFSTRRLYDAMARKKKVCKYSVIIEPDLEVFKHLLCTEDITDLLVDDNVDFVIGIPGEEIVSVLFQLFIKPIKGMNLSRTTMINSMEVILDPFQFISEEEIKHGQEYIALIQKTCTQLRLSMGCSDDQFIRFELLMKNKETMYNAWNGSKLIHKFKKVPTIVLGGGPSLEGFINEYKSNKKIKNALIIAVDAVLGRLLNEGIEPHIVLRCERKLTSIFKGVTKDQTKGIYYAAYPWTPPEFFDLFEDKMYLFRSNGVCLFTGMSHLKVDGGVSSGNAALEMALVFGAKDIILSGIDLCHIDGKTHVEGTEVEFNINRSKDKWSQIETNDGTERTTIPVWERCRNEFGQSIHKHIQKRPFKVYNTSEKGAVVPLTETAKWEDLRKLFNKPTNIKSILLSNLAKLPKKEVDAFKKKVIKTVEKLKQHKETVEITKGLAEDSTITTNREIYKMVEQCKATAKDNYELIKMIRANQANLDKLWSNVSDVYDSNYKQKCYNCITFRTLIFDVLQLDCFHYENQCNALVNQLDHMDQRCETYSQLTKQFLVKVSIV